MNAFKVKTGIEIAYGNFRSNAYCFLGTPYTFLPTSEEGYESVQYLPSSLDTSAHPPEIASVAHGYIAL